MGGSLSVIRQGNTQEVLTKTHLIHYNESNDNEGEKMFRVTVDGETKEWMTFEWALTDCLARGLDSEWTLEKVND